MFMGLCGVVYQQKTRLTMKIASFTVCDDILSKRLRGADPEAVEVTSHAPFCYWLVFDVLRGNPQHYALFLY